MIIADHVAQERMDDSSSCSSSPYGISYRAVCRRLRARALSRRVEEERLSRRNREGVHSSVHVGGSGCPNMEAPTRHCDFCRNTEAFIVPTGLVLQRESVSQNDLVAGERTWWINFRFPRLADRGLGSSLGDKNSGKRLSLLFISETRVHLIP